MFVEESKENQFLGILGLKYQLFSVECAQFAQAT